MSGALAALLVSLEFGVRRGKQSSGRAHKRGSLPVIIKSPFLRSKISAFSTSTKFQ